MSGGETFINSTVVFCNTCKQSEPASIVATSDGVFLRKLCDKVSIKETKLADSYEWYMERTMIPQDIRPPKKCHSISKGCPLDCGPCEMHSNEIHLPVFSITNDCNLDCPICFTHNRPDKRYYKSVDETNTILDHILAQKDQLEVINLTGGEPTMHPDFFDIIAACKRPQIQRITVNTNGIRIANDPEFAAKVKDSGIQLVLSLNTFDPKKSEMIHGRDISDEKHRALAVFEELSIPITILCVAIKDMNETDIADIVDTYMRKDFVKNIVIQTMTFTGANGSLFHPRKHITMDEVENALSVKRDFSPKDFFPLGSAHPLCYSVAYYIMCNDRLLSVSRLIEKARLTEMSGSSYLLSTGTDLRDEFMDGINQLWAAGEDDDTLRILKDFVTTLYPVDTVLTAAEREVIAADMIKAVYIHSHMDEDNFDSDRISRCADIVPDESGAMIPACSYNLIYRQRDERFWKN